MSGSGFPNEVRERAWQPVCPQPTVAAAAYDPPTNFGAVGH
jgi:hypothetical protein